MKGKQNIYSAKFNDGKTITRLSTNTYPYAWRVSWIHPSTGEKIVNDGFSANRELALKSAANHTPNKRRESWMDDAQAEKKRMFYYKIFPTIETEIVKTKREIPKSRHIQRIPGSVYL